MLTIFDLDRTLYHSPEFDKLYSRTLTAVVSQEKGWRGALVLWAYRRFCAGAGERALQPLGIPIQKWSDLLNEVPLDLIAPNPELVAEVRKLRGHKAIYTGSPTIYARRVLQKIGFEPNDFRVVLGLEPGEHTPLKWTESVLPFQYILKECNADPSDTIAVGDNWVKDLAPVARLPWIRATVLIGGTVPPGATPNEHYPDLLSWVQHQNKEVGDGQ